MSEAFRGPQRAVEGSGAMRAAAGSDFAVLAPPEGLLSEAGDGHVRVGADGGGARGWCGALAAHGR
jgi:hypothetical protein